MNADAARALIRGLATIAFLTAIVIDRATVGNQADTVGRCAFSIGYSGAKHEHLKEVRP